MCKVSLNKSQTKGSKNQVKRRLMCERPAYGNTYSLVQLRLSNPFFFSIMPETNKEDTADCFTASYP